MPDKDKKKKRYVIKLLVYTDDPFTAATRAMKGLQKEYRLYGDHASRCLGCSYEEEKVPEPRKTKIYQSGPYGL